MLLACTIEFMEHKIVKDFTNAKSRLILLDYDGTLTPLMPRPEQAKPNSELRQLLKRLSSKAHVVVISGRDHKVLDDWLGDLPIDFAAEHGLFYREDGGGWQTTRDNDQSWKESIKPMMQKLCNDLPGSLLEEAAGTLNWHYRDVSDQNIARRAANNLIKDLEPTVARLNLSILDGSKVVTVKLGGTDKGRVAQHWLAMRDWDFILAAGDDTTDEFLFTAMPPGAYTIKIGTGESAANFYLKSPATFLSLLQSI